MRSSCSETLNEQTSPNKIHSLIKIYTSIQKYISRDLKMDTHQGRRIFSMNVLERKQFGTYVAQSEISQLICFVLSVARTMNVDILIIKQSYHVSIKISLFSYQCFMYCSCRLVYTCKQTGKTQNRTIGLPNSMISKFRSSILVITIKYHTYIDVRISLR